jgi:RNA polymerase sigma-70 factor (ECF subfamily)
MLAGTLTKTSRGEHSAARPMTDPLHDLELIRRIAARDEAALRELYAAYGQRLYAYALRLTGDPAVAEDVVQDALVVTWQSAGRFRGEGRVLAWLLGIVHHTALKSLRHRSQPLSDEMQERLPDAGPALEEAAQAAEQSRALRRGIDSLSPEHRAVLELVFYQHLSLEETAAVCGCPVGTVKSRLSYARQHLRGLLSRMEDAP